LVNGVEDEVSFILCLQLVFGNLFVIRTLQIFRARALLSQSTVTKTGTVFCALLAIVSIFHARAGVSGTILLSLCIVLCLAVLFLLERRQIDALKAEIPLFLDRWILNLRMGLALPTARESALCEHSPEFRALMKPVFATQTAFVGRRRHGLLPAQLLFELERLQVTPHSALQRLENLRLWLRKSSEFRRKSGQAVRQTLIQSLVMLFLLLALCAWSVRRYTWSRCYDLIIMSWVLYTLGASVMFVLSRKAKWKI
jgi:Flp pilus assembly protein TadB